MIQRKQTIYLFFAGLITLTLLFIPFGAFQMEGTNCFEYNAFAIKNYSEGIAILHPIGNAILLIVTSVLSFLTIFFYKNRKLQLKLISINMFAILLAIFSMVYLYPNIIYSKNVNLANTKIEYNYVIIIIFVAAVGLYLAKKAIMKDEAMIKSADRLR